MTHRHYTAQWRRCLECGRPAADCSEYCNECEPLVEDDELRECNCCGRMKPNVTQCWTTCGLETWACEDCTSDPREAKLGARPDPDRAYDEWRDRQMEDAMDGYYDLRAHDPNGD